MAQTERDLKCEDRVEERMASRLSALREIWARCGSDDDDERDSAQEEFSNYGLSFDYVPPETFTDQDEGYWRWQISWGGPSDEFRIFASPMSKRFGQIQYKVHRIEYWFMDWFDGAHRVLSGDDLTFMREIWEVEFIDTGTAEAVMEKALEE